MTPGTLLLASGIAAVLGALCARRAPRLWLAATIAGCCSAGLAAAWILATRTAWEWRAPVALGGEPARMWLDGLGAFFLVLVSVIGGAGAIYAQAYWTDRRHPAAAPAGRAWWSALLGSMGLVLASAHGLLFLLAWEAFTVSSYFLITLDRESREARAAGWLFLAASHLGTLALFAFFALLAARTGSWELGPLRERAELAPLFWLALLGFGVKAGLFPLHVWLPSAHAGAPSHVSAVLSGAAIKLGVYGIARFGSWLPTPPGAGEVVVFLGAASAVLGVAFALGQHDLKRLLAYHSVENVGIILIGLGFALVASAHGDATWGALALAGGLLHVWNHGLFKALLFLGAGSVLQATGTRTMSRLGGLWRTMPWTAALFALGAAAISGLPPLNGFVSEFLVYLGLLEALAGRGAPALVAVPSIVLLAITGALALACFVKACGVVFLGAPRSPAAERASECAPLMRAPMVALAALCVAIGLGPALVWPALRAPLGAWRAAWAEAPAPHALTALGTLHVLLAASAGAAVLLLLLRARRRGWARAETWGCGYAAPTARMQYTAGSFAALLTEWFAWILRPVRHVARPQGLFPVHATFEERTPETVLERVVEPAGRVVLLASEGARRLQHGRLQAYLLYLIAGLITVAAVALGGWGS